MVGHPIAPATAPAAVKMVLFLFCAVLFLAYTNGANDNCVGPRREPVVVHPNGVAAFSSSGLSLSVGELSQCVEQYQGVLFGVDCQRWVDLFHYLSAGMVSFARGLNDTPKIVALLAAMKAFSFDISNAQTQWGTVRNIILSWIVTLPMAALSSALIYRLM